jgi:hypothetical protein
MTAGKSAELRGYADRLRSYSTDELEDIYFNIHILRHPLRYRLLMMEMERRKLNPSSAAPRSRVQSIPALLLKNSYLSHHPALLAAILAPTFVIIAAIVTFALYSPVWLFAVPLGFRGIQTAIAYVGWAAVPPILGAGVAGRLGGRGIYGICTLTGVVLGILLFNATGAPSAIFESIKLPTGGAGGIFGF